MSEERFQQLLRFFKALANQSRLKIVGILANREASVGELADLLDLGEPTVSHHLSMLRELGLVHMRAQGNAHIYALDEGALIRMNKDFFSAQHIASLVGSVNEQSWKEKVLERFIIDDRLTQIPAQRKKRLVILEWLVEKFAPDARYSEREVNEVIKRCHPDTAALRRYLIDYKYMERARGVYWRVPLDEQEAYARRWTN